MSSNDAANFSGNIPEHYVSGLGPHIFAGYAADIAIGRMETQIKDFALFAWGLVYGNPVIDQTRAQGGIDPSLMSMPLCRGCRKNLVPILAKCLFRRSYFRRQSPRSSNTIPCFARRGSIGAVDAEIDNVVHGKFP